MHAIVFDIDGTLIQSASTDDVIYKESVESVLGQVRFRGSLSDYELITDGGILLQLLEDNAVEPESHIIEAIKIEFLNRIQYHISLNGPFSEVPGARQLLERLAKSPHHAVAIATGGWRSTAQLKLHTAGFEVSGIPLATSDDAIDRTEIMKIALARLGRQFDAITYFGDGEWDKAACHRLGWNFKAVGSMLGGIESYHGTIVD